MPLPRFTAKSEKNRSPYVNERAVGRGIRASGVERGEIFLFDNLLQQDFTSVKPNQKMGR